MPRRTIREKHRRIPFFSIIGYEDDRSGIVCEGCALVVACFRPGQSRAERLQYAVKSWCSVDNRISTLELTSSVSFSEPFRTCSSDIRFRNQVAELNASGFKRIQLAHPGLFHDRVSTDVPILIAFSSTVAELIVTGSIFLCVLPAGGREALKLPEAISTFDELDPLDGLGADGSGDELDDEAGASSSQWRYRWPCPLHICRLAPNLRTVSSLESVLRDAAALLVGPEEAFYVTENLHEALPSDRTIAKWQVKMDMVGMLYDRFLFSAPACIMTYTCVRTARPRRAITFFVHGRKSLQ